MAINPGQYISDILILIPAHQQDLVRAGLQKFDSGTLGKIYSEALIASQRKKNVMDAGVAAAGVVMSALKPAARPS